jgi:hypothetical protein
MSVRESENESDEHDGDCNGDSDGNFVSRMRHSAQPAKTPAASSYPE